MKEYSSEWMHVRDLSMQKAYWLELFSDEIPVLDMETDFPRTQMRDFSVDFIKTSFDKELVGKIIKLANDIEGTEFMVLLAALMIVLGKYSRQEDIIIGTPIRCSTHRDMEKISDMFVNTIALRGCPEAGKSGIAFLREIKQVCMDAYANKEYPFEELVEELETQRDNNRNPFFDIMLAFESNEMLNLRGKEGESDLEIDVISVKDTYDVKIMYKTELYSGDTIERFIQHFKAVLDELTEHGDKNISEIKTATPKEEKQILDKFNDEYRQLTNADTILELFEEQVAKAPNLTAVVYKNTYLTYGILNSRANQVAHALRRAEVGVGDFVAIIAEKSLEMLIGIYGILKSGAAYVPMDPAYPKDRLNYMIDDCKPKALVIYLKNQENSEYQESLSMLQKMNNTLIIDLNNNEIQSEEEKNPDRVNRGSDVAYVIYTSGTTGNPKGVLIQHKSLVNLSVSFGRAYELTDKDLILQFASFSFDQSVSDIFTVISSGSGVCMIPEEYRRDPEQLKSYVNKTGVTVLALTPAYMNMLEPDSMPSVRLIDVGGEAPNLEVLKQWIICGKKVMNAYGPTEATVNATYCFISKDTKVLTIGKPMDNLNVFIMDGENLCGIGVPGELCISGIGLAKGYLNKPELTKEKFICNPYGKGKMYKTGDLARWMPDGTIDFLGRMDDQVKIRGYRIEIGEIVSVIQSLDFITDCVVLAKKDTKGELSLHGYIVGEKIIDLNKLKRIIAEKLPDYMIPQYMIQIEKIPVNKNGKVDKKVLTEINVLEKKREIVQPNNNFEILLWDIISSIIHSNDISIKDYLFELGINSINLLQILSEIRNYNLEIGLNDLKDKSIEQIAQKLKSKNPFYQYVKEKKDTGLVVIKSNHGDMGKKPISESPLYQHLSEYNRNIKNSKIIKKYKMLNIHRCLEHMNVIPMQDAYILIEGETKKENIMFFIRQLIKEQAIFRTGYFPEEERFVEYSRDDIENWYIPYLNESDYKEWEDCLYSLFHQSELYIGNALLSKILIFKISKAKHLILLFVHHHIWDATSEEQFMNMASNYFEKGMLAVTPKMQYFDYVENILNCSSPKWYDSKENILKIHKTTMKKIEEYQKVTHLFLVKKRHQIMPYDNDMLKQTVWDVLYKFKLLSELNDVIKIAFKLTYNGRNEDTINVLGMFLDHIPMLFNGDKYADITGWEKLENKQEGLYLEDMPFNEDLFKQIEVNCQISNDMDDQYNNSPEFVQIIDPLDIWDINIAIYVTLTSKYVTISMPVYHNDNVDSNEIVEKAKKVFEIQ